jgi:hypothetical protein
VLVSAGPGQYAGGAPASAPGLPYGGYDVWTHPELQNTPPPFVQPGTVGPGSSGLFRQGFYPQEDSFAPGDSGGVRVILPDSAPYFMDRRSTPDAMAGATGNAATGQTAPSASTTTGLGRSTLIGIGIMLGLLLVLEGYRPKL